MIPRYAPEWTNHNPSDPGITLIELAAWMTDLLIYRLNQVPDKNYVAFLNLLGIKLRAAAGRQGADPVHARRGRDQAARPARHPGVDAARDRGAHGHVRDRARRDGHQRAPRPLLHVLRRQLLREQPLHRSRAERRRCPVRGVRRRPADRALPVPVRSAVREHRRGLAAARSTSAPPSAAAAISRACSSGSTGRARAGRTSSRRRSRSIAARSRSSGRSGSSRRRSTTSRGCGCAAGSPRSPSRPRTPRSTRSARGSRSSARACCRRRRSRTSTTTRSSGSTSARTSIRSARSRRSTASSTSRATSCCRPPTRTSRSRCCSPTRA